MVFDSKSNLIHYHRKLNKKIKPIWGDHLFEKKKYLNGPPYQIYIYSFSSLVWL